MDSLYSYFPYSDRIGIMFDARALLIRTLYQDTDFQHDLLSIISRYIDILKSSYDPDQMAFTIKFKKTSLKKYPNFKPDVTFFYNILGEVIKSLLVKYEARVIDSIVNSPFLLERYYSDLPSNVAAYRLYTDIINGNVGLLINTQCIDDNVIQIIL